MKTRTRVAAVFIVIMAVLSFSQAAFALGDPGSHVSNCNGILPTPGSANTLKVLKGGTLLPGGTATYEISFPIDPADVGNTFVVSDCLLIGQGTDLSKYDVIESGSFTQVPNAAFFDVTFTVQIPVTAQDGDRICNVAKTTNTPSASPASNRKAGPACFLVGGDARVEKHSTTDPTGAAIPGATFSFSNCVNTALDPTLQPLIIGGVSYGNSSLAPYAGHGAISVVATTGTIAFSGTTDSHCSVTETDPPPGYTLPGTVTQTLTISSPTTATVITFLDAPAPGSLKIVKEAPANSTDTYTFEINCDKPLHTYSSGLHIQGSGSVTQSGIPAGSVCTVVETDPGSKYNAPTYDPVDATRTIVSGGVVTVTVSNSYAPSSLTITKVAPAGDQDTFTFDINCDTPLHTYSGLTIKGSGSVSQDGIPAGSVCTVVERAPGSKYNSPTYDPTNATRTIGAGTEEGVAVTVTNTYAPSSLTINKVAPAGVDDTFTFDINCDTPLHTYPGLTIKGSGSVTQDGIPAGSVCTVVERNPGSKYNSPTYDPTNATRTIGAGTEAGVSVTVTNTYAPGSLTITKVAPAGVKDTFTFNIDCGGDNTYQLQIVGSGSKTQSPIPAGSDCTITEVLPVGYDQPTFSPSNEVTVGPAEEVSVTVTNTLLPLGISIAKTADPISGGPGDPVTYTYVVKNTGKVDLINVSVDDDKLGHIGDIASLAVGESKTLTFDTTMPTTAGALTNVGTAVGHDRFGRSTSAHADATVTVVLAVQLAKTGTDTRFPMEAGFALLGIGFVFVGLARRRQNLASDAIQSNEM